MTSPDPTAGTVGPVFGSQAADNAAWDEVRNALASATPGRISDADLDDLTGAVTPILARLVDLMTSSDPTAGTALGEGNPYDKTRAEGWDAFESRWKAGGDIRQCYAEAFEAWQRNTSPLLAAAREAGMREIEEERADLERQNCELLRSISAEQAAHAAELRAAREAGREEGWEGCADDLKEALRLTRWDEIPQGVQDLPSRWGR